MKISYPCAIKGCSTFTALDRVLKDDEFVVCTSCENAIVLSVHQKMEKDAIFNAGSTKEFAVVLNAWRRGRKGIATNVRPATVGN